jgi:mannose-1-phosphate guanylyltransferase
VPDFPATQYGYIKLKACSLKLKANKVYYVERFVEKPDLAAAKRFMKSGNYLWNSGIFIFGAGAMLHNMRKFAPRIAAGVKSGRVTASAYKRLPNISIDYAVMERADNIYCVKCDYGWQDVGSFESLKEILRRESKRFVERGGKVTRII